MSKNLTKAKNRILLLISLLACVMEDDGEKQNRILLRPWLEKMLETKSILGLEWCDEEKTMFRVPWKHRSKKDWSLDDSRVFLEWARNTGRLKEEVGNPDFAQLKTRFRCALNKAPDIEEVSALRCDRGEEPYKVYRFTKHKDSSVRKVTVAMSFSRKLKNNQEEVSNSSQKLNAENVFSDVSNEDSEVAAKEGTVLQMVNSDLGYSDRSSRFKVENEREAGKTFIPLSVELMTTTSSDCSGSDHNSPTMSDQPFDGSNGNTAKSADDVQSSGNFESKTFQLSSSCTRPLLNSRQFEETEPHSECLQGLPSNEHMLQVASLFVEAEATRTQQETRKMDQNSHFVIDETHSSEYQNLIVIKPEDDAHEAAAAVVDSSAEWFAADCSAQLIHRSSTGCCGFAGSEFKPTSFDFTKKDTNKDCRTNVHQPKSARFSRFEQVVEGDSKETLMNFIGEISDEELNFQPSDSVQEIRCKVQQNEQLLLSKAKMLYMWEERLKKWEAKLQAAEDACFWKNKYLDAQLAVSGVFAPPERQQLFPLGNPGQSASQLILPVRGVHRDSAELYTATTSGTVQNFSQNKTRSELGQQTEQLGNLNAQINGNVEQMIRSHETILRLGKLEKRQQVTVISDDSVFSKEPSVKKRKMEYKPPITVTETSRGTLFAPVPTLGKFVASSTEAFARFQLPVKCATNQAGKIRYECKPIPPSKVSDVVHPSEDVALGSEVEKAVDLRNFSLPTKCLQESGKEKIFPSSISSISIPSIAYVLPSISVAKQPDDVSLNQLADPNFSPVKSANNCSTPYTVTTEVISDCESESELIIDSSKCEDTEAASLTEEKEDHSSSKQTNLVESSSNMETFAPAGALVFSEKHSLCTYSGKPLTANQEKLIRASPNPTDLKIFQEWLKGITQKIVEKKSSKTRADDIDILSNSMQQERQRGAQEDTKESTRVDDQRLCGAEMGNLPV